MKERFKFGNAKSQKYVEAVFVATLKADLAITSYDDYLN